MKIICDDIYYRDLTQLAWCIFGDLDVEIFCEIKLSKIHFKVIFDAKTYESVSDFTEKNDVKRVLFTLAQNIISFDAPWGILTGVNPSKLMGDDIQEYQQKYFVKNRQANLAFDTKEFTKNTKTHENDIALYINIPFCKSKCKYCSFVSNSIDTQNRYTKTYIKSLLLEIKALAPLVKNKRLVSIYIGGGTPTALNESELFELLCAINSNFNTENLNEFTVEAGRVDTINEEKLNILKQANVSRISINPQVFDDEILRKIGRNHTVSDVIKIYEKAKKYDFKAINMDIIYGLGGKFNKTVDTLIDLDPENITIHTLAIKKGSLIDKNYIQEYGDINYFYDKLPQKYTPYYMYRQQYMIKPYENVGFFRDNTPCLYNVYMMENLIDILSLGAGSTTKINGLSYFNNKYPLDYINNIEKIINDKKNILGS